MEIIEELTYNQKWQVYKAYLQARKEFKILIERENRNSVTITVVVDDNRILEVKTKSRNEDKIVEQIYEAVFEDETVLRYISKKFLKYFPHKEILQSYLHSEEPIFIIEAEDKRGIKRYVVDLIQEEYCSSVKCEIYYKVNFKKKDFEEA